MRQEGRGGSSDFTKAEGRWRDVAAPPTKASIYYPLLRPRADGG